MDIRHGYNKGLGERAPGKTDNLSLHMGKNVLCAITKGIDNVIRELWKQKSLL